MLPDQHFYSENNVERRELLPDVFARLIWGEKIMMGIIDIEPDTEVPEHLHPHEQCGRILEGAAWFYIDTDGVDDEKLLVAGDHYVIPDVIPGDTPHRVVATENGCVALDIWSPISEEYIGDKLGFFSRG